VNALKIIQDLGPENLTDFILLLPGTILLAVWLLKTSLGKTALDHCPPRRNNMPLYLPLIGLFLWFGTVSVALSLANNSLDHLPEWQIAFVNNLILILGSTATIVLALLLVRKTFARRLKGFGLNLKTIPGDLGIAILNLLAVWPALLAMIILTSSLGKLLFGPDFHIRQHEELKLVTQHPQLSLRLLIIIAAVVVVPVLEEILFRGMFQSLIRSYTDRPWLSVAVSSALFASAHQNPQHWPALFALAICLGYAYEKSGSLFRPIFIHCLFNAVNIAAALSQ